MNSKKIQIKILSYLNKNDGEYIDIELKSVIIKHFKGEDNATQRLEMKKLLDFLSSNDLIKIIELNGIGFITDLKGRYIPRKDISVKARITTKGAEYLKENDKNIKHNFSFYLNIFLAIITVTLGLSKCSNDVELKSRQEKINNLSDSLNQIRKEKTHLLNRNTVLLDSLKIISHKNTIKRDISKK